MTSPDDLLAAIIADPANNDLLLVFADLLDDRGEGERASFIRVQCEIARLQAEEVACFNEALSEAALLLARQTEPATASA